MPEINQLSASDSLQPGDLLPAFIQNNGDARKVSLSLLLAFMQENLTFPVPVAYSFVTQRSAPNETGFSVGITDNGSNIHLILTPVAGYADGEIVLPSNLTAVDKQEVLVNTTNQVTAFTLNANGAAAVFGAPTSLGADDFFRMKYDQGANSWYRVG